MKSMLDIVNEQEQQVNEAKAYDDMIAYLQEAKEQHKPIDEGLFTGLFTGALSFAAGPAIMKAVCEALGIDQKGALGNLMTSRLILTIIGAKLGFRA